MGGGGGAGGWTALPEGFTWLPVGVDHHELDLVTGQTRSNIFMQEGHLLKTPFHLATRQDQRERLYRC